MTPPVPHIVLLLALLAPLVCAAAEPPGKPLSRYTTRLPQASAAQQNLLSAVVTINFPQYVKTVGEALAHLLKGSGYKLAGADNADPFTRQMYRLELPTVQRTLGPVSITQGLRALAGRSWNLVEDPVHRLISFELQAGYRKHYQTRLKTASAPVPRRPATAKPANVKSFAADDRAAKSLKMTELPELFIPEGYPGETDAN